MSFIQSNYHGFGSHHVPGDLGFALQNRGTLFALDDKHLNRLEPHKRPFHTIIPAMVTKDDKPYLVFGVMGGDFQAQGHVQVLVNMIDFGMNVQEAGEAPRIEHVGSPTPTGKPGDPKGGKIQAERGIPGGRAARAAAARPSGRRRRRQRRRLPGHPHRPAHRHAPWRLGGPQGRLRGGVLRIVRVITSQFNACGLA